MATAVRAIRAALDEGGLLMLHDAELPSVTTLVAGEPIRGSWWAHPAGGLVYAALESIEDELVTAKLVAKKVTLIAPALWPALAAVGASREAWQTTSLSPTATSVLERVHGAGRLRSTDLEPAARKATTELEERLLVAAREVHTESGAHCRELSSWRTFAEARGILREGLSVKAARAALEAAVSGWSAKATLPWRTARKTRSSPLSRK